MFFTLFGYWPHGGGGGGGSPKGLAHNLLMRFFTLDSSKMEVFQTCFFDIVTTQCDHPSYLKHVFGRIYMFFTLFGYWVGGGRSPKGLVHNLLMQLFTLDSSKMEVFKTCFFRYCDHLKSPSMLCKACFRPYLHVFHPIWVLGWEGGLPRDWYTTCSCSFSLWTTPKWKFSKLVFFDIVTT